MVGIAQLPEELSVSANTAQAGAGKIDSVITLVAGDKASLSGLALAAPVGSGEFQRCIGAFRPRVSKQCMIEIARRQFSQAFGQSRRARI